MHASSTANRLIEGAGAPRQADLGQAESGAENIPEESAMNDVIALELLLFAWWLPAAWQGESFLQKAMEIANFT